MVCLALGSVKVNVPALVSAITPLLTRENLLLFLTIGAPLCFVSFLLLCMIVVAFFTPQLGKISSLIERKICRTFLLGLLIAILVLPVAVILALSLVGIIFLPIWALLIAVAGLFGYVAAAHLCGKKILRALRISSQPMMVETIAGVIILCLVSLIPILGWIIMGIAVCCGLGGATLTKFGLQEG